MNEKLKPCHLCKCEYINLEYFICEYKKYYQFRCFKCGYTGFERKTIKGAHKAWNRES